MQKIKDVLRLAPAGRRGQLPPAGARGGMRKVGGRGLFTSRPGGQPH
jgi:hypothetical protein